MKTEILFEKFEKGRLFSDKQEVSFESIEWQESPTAQGVFLKHLVKKEQTEGLFSYHLVKILPHGKIPVHFHAHQLETHEVIAGTGVCICNGEERDYCAGTISILPAQCEHEVIAKEQGLYLFAKFMPALC